MSIGDKFIQASEESRQRLKRPLAILLWILIIIGAVWIGLTDGPAR